MSPLLSRQAASRNTFSALKLPFAVASIVPSSGIAALTFADSLSSKWRYSRPNEKLAKAGLPVHEASGPSTHSVAPADSPFPVNVVSWVLRAIERVVTEAFAELELNAP